jgi:hypothetical protein
MTKLESNILTSARYHLSQVAAFLEKNRTGTVTDDERCIFSSDSGSLLGLVEFAQYDSGLSDECAYALLAIEVEYGQLLT